MTTTTCQLCSGPPLMIQPDVPPAAGTLVKVSHEGREMDACTNCRHVGYLATSPASAAVGLMYDPSTGEVVRPEWKS